MKTVLISTVNEINIVSVMNEKGERFVPIKPICEIIGVDYPSQFTKLKNDYILAPTIGLHTMVGGDGKLREMTCIPLKYVFGWIFSISPKNVHKDAREILIAYKKKCYDIIYDYFTKNTNHVISKITEIEATKTKINKLTEIVKAKGDDDTIALLELQNNLKRLERQKKIEMAKFTNQQKLDLFV